MSSFLSSILPGSGSQSSHDQVFLVTGGSADVGQGIVCELLNRGYKVATLTRKPECVNMLKSEHQNAGDRFFIVEGDASTVAGAKRIFQAVKEKFGRVDHVIASIGGWQQLLRKEKLIEGERNVDDFVEAIQVMAIPQIALANGILPQLADQKNSSYTIISGSAPSFFMGKGWGNVATSVGAVHGLSTTLRGELKDSNVRINEVRIGLRVLQKEDVDRSKQVPSSEMAKAILAVALTPEYRGQVFNLYNQHEVEQLVEQSHQVLKSKDVETTSTKQSSSSTTTTAGMPSTTTGTATVTSITIPAQTVPVQAQQSQQQSQQAFKQEQYRTQQQPPQSQQYPTH